MMIDKKFELGAGRGLVFPMMIGHFQIVSPIIPRSFMYFSNFREIVCSNFENMLNTKKIED